MIKRDDPHLTLDEALSGPIPSGIRGMVLGSNGSSRSVKVRELSDGGFDEIHDLTVRRELPCGGAVFVHPLFWMRRHGPPVPANSPGQWGKTGQGGGASGGKSKPKKGGGHPSPSPRYTMPENFVRGFPFGQQKLNGVEIVGGGRDPAERRNNKLELLRRQVVLQRQAAAQHKKEVTRLLQQALIASREDARSAARLKLKEEAAKVEQKEKAAAYQADRLEAKIQVVLSGKRRKTSAKTAKTKSDRKNAKKNKKNKGGQGGSKED